MLSIIVSSPSGRVIAVRLYLVFFFFLFVTTRTRKAQPIQTKFLHATSDWNSSAKFEKGHHRSHGLANILEKHPKHLFSHQSYDNTPPPPLGQFIIWDMALSLRAGQSLEQGSPTCGSGATCGSFKTLVRLQTLNKIPLYPFKTNKLYNTFKTMGQFFSKYQQRTPRRISSYSCSY